MKAHAALTVALFALWPFTGGAPSETIVVRDKPQEVRLYGDAHDSPVIVASGDGGWLHLGPHVADVLAAHHYYVVGFDSKAYLDGFTGHQRQLTVDQVPADFATLVAFASSASGRRPVLIGVSEGAGLAVLAAASSAVKPQIRGVVGLGLGDRNELAWRWKDSIIYLTKGVPAEPTFSAAAFIPLVTPTPIALLRSTNDEYVSREESDRIAGLARAPKRVWTIPAADHRFSDNLSEFDARLFEALHWIEGQLP